jgi:hypothetical protein
MCVSWPQACITETGLPSYSLIARLAKGRSTSSRTGRASMSARSATTGPGSAPSITATMPCFATPLRGEAHLAQASGDVLRRLDLAVRELRVLVEVAPPLDHPRLDFAGELVDRVGERRWIESARGRGGSERSRDDGQSAQDDGAGGGGEAVEHADLLFESGSKHPIERTPGLTAGARARGRCSRR